MPIRHIIVEGYVPGGDGTHLIPTWGYTPAVSSVAVAQAHDPGPVYEADDAGAVYAAHDPGAAYEAAD